MKKIKIVDLSTLIPGPFASFLLGKYLDVEIIKFEDIKTGDPLSNLRPTKEGIGLSYTEINKNKKIIKVDFAVNDKDAISKEIKNADIFLHNYKEGKADKISLGYADVKKLNPDILYCSITGYPKSHPLSGYPAHDLNVLALSGYLDMAYKLNGVLFPPPMQLADIFTSYHLNLRIMSALITGEKGKEMSISMYEAMAEAMTLYKEPYIKIKKEINSNEAIMNGQLPCYGIYQTRDKGYAVVAALEKPLWIDFVSHLNRSDLITRQFDREAVREIAKEMQKKNKKEWLKNEFCVSPVFSFLESDKLC